MATRSVVVLGGGCAGLEAAFLLRRRLGDSVELTVVADRDSFGFRPSTIYVPFGADPARFEVPLWEPAERRNIGLIFSRVQGVDTRARRFQLERSRLPYDYLVIATGAAMCPEEVPGLAEHARLLWKVEGMMPLRQTVQRLVRLGRDSVTTQVMFLVPPRTPSAAPLYEAALMLETHLRRARARGAVRMMFATAEPCHLQALGPKLHAAMEEEFRRRGIEGFTGHAVEEVTPEAVRFRNGQTIAYDELIAFPPCQAAVRYDGLPADERGFLRVAPENRAVIGFDGIFAPGDAGDFPLKQAFLAFLQADAVAEAIAGALRREGPRQSFDPVTQYVMDELDSATVARVPLEVTGRPEAPVGLRQGADQGYRVRVSRLWRLRKRAMGDSVLRHFRAGEPFKAAGSWTALRAGLEGMASLITT